MKEKYYKLLCFFKDGSRISHKNLLRLCKNETLINEALNDGLITICRVNDIEENVYIITAKGRAIRDS